MLPGSLPLLVSDLVDQRADFLNLNSNVAFILQHDLGVAEEADSSGCACQEDRACLESRSLREVADLLGDGENHVSLIRQ